MHLLFQAIQFLDMILPGGRRHHRVMPIKPKPEVVESIKAEAVPDTMNVAPQAADSAEQAQEAMGFIGDSSDDNTMLIWAIIAVVIALVACFFLLRMYRRRTPVLK